MFRLVILTTLTATTFIQRCLCGDPTKMISVVVEEFDGVTTPFVKHLNASLLYNNELFGLDEDAIQLDVARLPDNYSTSDSLKSIERILHRKTAFIVSLAKSEEGKAVLSGYSAKTGLPVVQLHLHPWLVFQKKETGLEENVGKGGKDADHFGRSAETHSYSELIQPKLVGLDNYVTLVPGYIVMDNILVELISSMNITTELTVVYDEHYDISELYDWKDPYLSLRIPVRFESAIENQSLIPAHIRQLEQTTKNIIMLTATSVAEWYIRAAAPQIEVRIFEKFIVFSKDTLAFKCDECNSADLFWIQVTPMGKGAEKLRNFAEFLRQEELDVDMNYTVRSCEELQISYSIDIISLAFEHVIAGHDSILSRANKDRMSWLSDTNSSVSVEYLLNRKEVTNEEFGKFLPYKGNDTYYQDIQLIISKVERREAEPDISYYKYMGNWSLSTGIVPQYTTLGENIRLINHFRIVTIIQEPFVIRKEAARDGRENSNTEEFDGYCIDLLKLLQQDLNFTYDLFLIEDNKFGSVDENGNWDGMIGALVNGRAEIALGPISVLAERENDIDFTSPFYDLVGTTILMRRADVEYSLFKFLKVLEWPVWLCIAGAYLFTSMLLWVFDKFSPYSYTNNKEKYANEAEKREFTLKECLWFCMTSLTPQGGGEAPKNVSGRLVAATWWLFGFIIIASYTANLAAFLTVSRMEQTISSLDDLAKQYKIEYSPIKGGATETYFRRMAEIEEQFYNIWKMMSLNETMNSRDRAKLAVWDYPVSDKFTNMWRFMQESKLPKTVEEGVARVLSSDKGYAFIGDAMEIKYAVLTNCRLQQVGTEFSRKPYAIAVQTEHPLKEHISSSILKLLNERKLETLKEKWWHQNPKRKECHQAEDDTSGISIQNIGGVFIVILAGIGVSLVILVFEYLYYTQRDEAVERKSMAGSEASRGNSMRGKENGKSPEDLKGVDGANHLKSRNGHVVHYTNSAFSYH